jgi:hypothetical protein
MDAGMRTFNGPDLDLELDLDLDLERNGPKPDLDADLVVTCVTFMFASHQGRHAQDHRFGSGYPSTVPSFRAG